MKLLIDINIVLDIALGRQPWAGDAALLLAEIVSGRAEGLVAGHTITTIHYIVAKEKGRQTAAAAISDLLRIVIVVPLETADFQQALVLGLNDFEDAVHATAAMKVGADYVVTRNGKDFRAAPVEARTPAEILALL